MSYFAEPNHIEYDAWFDENIDPSGSCELLRWKGVQWFGAL